MLAAAFETGRGPQDLPLIPARCRVDRDQARLPLGERAGLVHNERIHLSHHLDRLGVLEQHAGSRAFASGHHDRQWRREPQRARAGDDQHRHRCDQGIGHARLWPDEHPDSERDDGDKNDRRDEVSGDDVGQLLNRRTAPLRLGDHLYDLGEQCLGADLLCAHGQGAGPVDGRADDLVAGGLLDRDRFAGDHRLVDGARAFDDDAVDRDFFTGPHPQEIARVNPVERHVLILAVADAPGRLGGET